jgi:protein phosphatase 1G
MGQYRSQPDRNKKTEVGQSKRLAFAATGMCGWRTYMEDAHISKDTFVSNYSLFAVFDGHGGGEVARFTEKHFPEELANNENFQNKKFEQALTETFLKMDRMLKTVEGEKELKKIKKELIDKQNADTD